MNRKWISSIAVVVGMLVLLLIFTTTYADFQQALERAEYNISHFVLISLCVFLFGVLIEWKALGRIIFEKRIKVNWLLVPAILLTILTFIPRLYWTAWFGLGGPFFIEVFKIPETQILLTAFAGILFVRALDRRST
ncbi:hypothetical protein [Alkalibacillus haloalkaliphilus]|uniref:Uncharacterized protein n=1 Tax=Alkalibacillus haloalkaliphilus TaxID=94136 RepID=A0A511W3C7_9BACI|nr:hypothetical protein [Alkalibacillus haloalkaliphilus]GEN45589.1 hypothetical protein AHA02nite_13650 [Alkalibacillus haloalkaliphilus]